MTVAGRAALVTGAAAGAGVAVVDRDAAGVDRVVAELGGPDRRVIGLVADVSSAPQVDDAVARAASELGGLDVLVNNAGVIAPETEVADMSDDVWERILRVNLSSQFLCCRAAVPLMRDRGHGRIVNIASRSWLGGAGLVNYAASKAGVVGLTRSLAIELGRYGITVNCVSPTLVLTPLFAAMPEHERAADLAKAQRNPIPRLGTPRDVATAVLFFASDEADYITGQHLYVGGGADLWTSGTL